MQQHNTQRPQRTLWLIGMTLAAAVCTTSASPVSDDFESTLVRWQATGFWGITKSRANSPTHSATDTQGACYANDSDTSLTPASAIELTSIPRPALAFRHAHDLEDSFDFRRVEISTAGGAFWAAPPLGIYTGNRPAFTREQIDFAAFGAPTQVKVRFRMTTDSSGIFPAGERW